MISAKNRFHGHNSLQYLHRKGQVVHAKGIVLKYSQSQAGKPYRAAVIVSKKVHKSAVVRNRIRRRVYECLRERLSPELTADLAVQVYDVGFAIMPAEQVSATIGGLLTKAKLL